ncbi:MAG: hypothetical protein ACI9G1_002596 [Pirellulaceae bacterium]|jgi:hypothetical protein
MEIPRAAHQPSESLLEFYAPSKWGDDERFVGGADAMQRLLNHLADVPGPTLWGCTSHQTLNLMEDPNEGPSSVHIRAIIVNLSPSESGSRLVIPFPTGCPNLWLPGMKREFMERR